jgi:lipoprotein NlpD
MTRAAGLACIVIVAVSVAGCTTRRWAPVVDRGRSAPPAASAAQPVPPGSYMVKRGDTLYSIALDNGADYREVAQWNGLDDPTKISIGQVLRVRPPEDRSAVQVAPARGAGRVEARPLDSAPSQGRGDGNAKTEPKAVRLPYSRENVAILSKEDRPDGGEAIAFIWPAKGKILAGFGEPRSKGIDIEGRIGDPVVAAAAGRVTYSGTGIPGLGKLVVIKHDNGFITVYAHNKDILVKEQQSVARGQKIAEIGSTDAERPKLHFQIRKGSAAVDPMRYLPAL